MAPAPRQLLRSAHMLFEAGRFMEAAPLFTQLAVGAQAMGLPVAPRLYLQAARALLQARQIPSALAQFRTALPLLAAAGAAATWQPALSRFLEELRAAGFAREADELQSEVSAAPGWTAAPEEAPAARQRASLPTHCPQCGGAMRSDEADWIDEDTASCAYCGSPVKRA